MAITEDFHRKMVESLALPDQGESLTIQENISKQFVPVDISIPIDDFISRQEKWDRRFLELAKHISTWSKDPSTQVGAVVVDDRLRVVGTGYNGFPAGVSDAAERYMKREIKYKMVVHAEENAVLTAGHRSRGGTIYVFPAFGTPPLCSTCAKTVIQAGIVRVVGYNPEVSSDVAARWAEELGFARLMCEEAGVEMTMLVPSG